MSNVFLYTCPLFLFSFFFGEGFLLNAALTDYLDWLAMETPRSSWLNFLGIGTPRAYYHTAFYVGAGDVNSDPKDCTSNA